MRTIKTEKELISFLRGMREQADPAAPTPEPAPTPPPASPAAPTTPGAGEAARPITVDDIIEKLNIVRSGRSTKDGDVKRELNEYIAQFSEEEKTALVAFLEGLGQILTSGVDSQNAVDPQDPYSLSIKKVAGSAEGVAIKPPRSTAPTPTPAPAPVPIRVGG
jgi:hypothetical protein